MSPQLWWYVARSTGIVAWAVSATAVVWGLLLSTRPPRGRLRPGWVLDLHRHLGALTLAFVGLHVAALVADSYVPFGWLDVLVPLASSWKPGPVAAGVVAAELLVVVEATSLLRSRLSTLTWRRIHRAGFVVFWSATWHFASAGTERRNPVALGVVEAVAALVLFLTLVRILTTRTRSRPAPAPAATGSGPTASARSDPLQV